LAQRPKHDLIVIGASMGGVEALMALVAQFPKNLPAAVCIVLHVAARQRSVLPNLLSRSGLLPAEHPEDGAHLMKGHIYVAPNDHHLLVEDGHVRVVKGPRENNHRPAVDSLFRSAALAYGPRVVGVVLTGALDCGTAGLIAIKAQGGLAVVQDPEDAYCPDMPRSALEYVQADHTVPMEGMGALLDKLARSPVSRGHKRPPALGLQREVSKLMGKLESANTPPAEGKPSHFSCPDCGGVLFETADGGQLRFNCRVGHAFTDNALAVGQEQALEGALWAAVRSLEESAALARRMARHARERNHGHSARRYDERAREVEHQARIIRQAATSGELSARQVELAAGELQEPPTN
jgi:two-component system, chemotaxis family, protein-glutamate methylesterase/glutaminase